MEQEKRSKFERIEAETTEGFYRRSYKLKSGRTRVSYYALFTDWQGRRKPVPLGRDIDKARAKLERRHALDGEEHDFEKASHEKSARKMTFSNWVAGRKELKDACNLRPLLAFFGNTLLASIDDALVTEYREKRKTEFTIRHGRPSKKHVSNATINKEVGRLGKYLLRARAKKYQDGVSKFPMDPEVGRNRIVTAEGYDKLVSNCRRDWARKVIRAAYETALSRGDILGLKRAEIGEHVIKLECGRGKTGAPVTIPIVGDGLKELVAELRSDWKRLPTPINDDERKDALAFTIDGQPIKPSTFEAHFRMACKRAGLKGVRFHDLRHTRITMWAFSGVPTAAAMTAAGHLSVASHKKYQNLSEQDRLLVSVFENCYKKVSDENTQTANPASA